MTAQLAPARGSKTQVRQPWHWLTASCLAGRVRGAREGWEKPGITPSFCHHTWPRDMCGCGASCLWQPKFPWKLEGCSWGGEWCSPMPLQHCSSCSTPRPQEARLQEAAVGRAWKGHPAHRMLVAFDPFSSRRMGRVGRESMILFWPGTCNRMGIPEGYMGILEGDICPGKDFTVPDGFSLGFWVRAPICFLIQA